MLLVSSFRHQLTFPFRNEGGPKVLCSAVIAAYLLVTTIFNTILTIDSVV